MKLQYKVFDQDIWGGSGKRLGCAMHSILVALERTANAQWARAASRTNTQPIQVTGRMPEAQTQPLPIHSELLLLQRLRLGSLRARRWYANPREELARHPVPQLAQDRE